MMEEPKRPPAIVRQEPSLAQMAAVGSLDAQREMVAFALSDTTGTDYADRLTVAETWARVAASHLLATERDKGTLMSVLALVSERATRVGDSERAELCDAEGIHLCAAVADGDGEGAELAARHLTSLLDHSPLATVQAAKSYTGGSR